MDIERPVEARVAIYTADARLLEQPGAETAFIEYLSAAELASLKQAKSRKRYREFLVSRVLARSALSAWSGTAGSAWSLAKDGNGRPRSCCPDDSVTAPSISLSHSADCVVCALSADGSVGVDVERVRARDVDAIAGDAFTDHEWDWVCRKPSAERLQAFYQIWTLKEACSKALGTGLVAPPRAFGFEVSAHGARLSSFPGVAPPAWFSSFIPQSEFMGALALLTSSASPPSVAFHALTAPGSLSPGTAQGLFAIFRL